MKVLLVGNGGREHALAWRLRQSPSVSRIVCPNGNPGIGREADTPRIPFASVENVADYAANEKFDLVVVGPEAPLEAGLVDLCQARGIRAFGPTRDGARIEFSKAFSKEIMAAAGIPTARAEAFTDFEKALDYGRGLGLPVVVKADGLAAGKGVVICTTDRELQQALWENLKDHRFGEASLTVVVEEFLEGEEASIIALTDGEEVYPLAPSQDHKRAFDGDEGPNTGGMGTYAPAPVVDEEVLAGCYSDVLRPLVAELSRRGITYRGVIFVGLMITPDGPRVLEFNARFGDPETQVILPLLEGDLGEILLACNEGKLGSLLAPDWKRAGPMRIGIRPDHAVCVVMASGGYPNSYETGKVIEGLESALPDSMIFHAGTERAADGSIRTSGGRVLGITAWAPTLQAAAARAYQLAEWVKFDGCRFRRDIAHRALQPRSVP